MVRLERIAAGARDGDSVTDAGGIGGTDRQRWLIAIVSYPATVI
ncbi:MAG: hypothetical protein WDN31_22440 [Hyphomicrobium sp.]